MKMQFPWLLLAATGLCTASVLSLADDVGAPEVARLLGSGQILSQEDIIRRVAEQHPGEVTEVELERKSGRYVYEVDVLGDSGEKTEIKLDARSGEVLSVKSDDDQQADSDADDEDDD